MVSDSIHQYISLALVGFFGRKNNRAGQPLQVCNLLYSCVTKDWYWQTADGAIAPFLEIG